MTQPTAKGSTMKPNYDPFPITQTGIHAPAWAGWESVAQQVLSTDDSLVVVESYPGTDDERIIAELTSRRQFDHVVRSTEIFPDTEDLTAYLQPWLTEDRVFGKLFFGTIRDLVDVGRLDSARQRVRTSPGRTLIVGFGASLIADGGLLVYADLNRWEIQLRMRSGTISNWLADNYGEDILRMYKRGYFIEWRVADRLKFATLPGCAYYLETNDNDRPVMTTSGTYHEALGTLTRRPFRLVPYFDAGVWGGNWMETELGIPMIGENLAWGFDGVPEENSLALAIGDQVLQVPAMNLVKQFPKALLGEKVFARFGAEYPIRFDFLDTVGGQNLSLQVHPTTEYIHENFGMSYTQDESYYILAAGPDAAVYLGLREGADPAAFISRLEAAETSGVFDDEEFVNRYPAKAHDHFLIPAGTVHCSASDTLVLEISATPYIFTFKLWDWGRVGLDGVPRPVHVNHGKNVIAWERTDSWVRQHLTPNEVEISRDDNTTVVSTGLHELEFIETVRYDTRTPVTVRSEGRFSQLNLVEGAEVEVSSPSGAFDSYMVHYAETFIVPAAVEEFVLTPGPGVNEVKVIRAFVRSQKERDC